MYRRSKRQVHAQRWSAVRPNSMPWTVWCCPAGNPPPIDKLMRLYGIAEPLRTKIAAGFPVYGSCAGMILLADRITDPALDAAVFRSRPWAGWTLWCAATHLGGSGSLLKCSLPFRRTSIPAKPGPGAEAEKVHAVFIRAPWVEKVGSTVQVLAKVLPAGDGRIRCWRWCRGFSR